MFGVCNKLHTLRVVMTGGMVLNFEFLVLSCGIGRVEEIYLTLSGYFGEARGILFPRVVPFGLTLGFVMLPFQGGNIKYQNKQCKI